ncbi:MAG: sugar-binding protein [Haloarculaceae archaeon]
MDRRRFLRSAAAASAVGIAGCPQGDSNETDTATDAGDTPTSGAETPTPTDQPPTGTPTESPGTPTDTDEPTDTPTEETTTSPPQGLPRLQTDGNWIVTENGEKFTPRGSNVVEPLFGHRNAAARGGDYMKTLEMAADPETGWYNNVVRVPVTTWGIDELGYEEYASRFIDTTVEHCKKQGVYVILDYHIIQDWKNEDVRAGVREFWDFFAPRYADEPHVLYEFWNEPQNPADNTLENWKAWRDVAQPLVDRIREDAPETPIIVGSPGWTSLTKWAAEAPFEGENLIYAGHIYPGDGKSAAELDPQYGKPAEEVPVMITEWGYDAFDDTQPGTRSNFGQPFREWLENQRPNVGWTAWCLDSHWHPAMLDFLHNTTGGEYYHGHFVKKWLYDAREANVPAAVQRDGAEYAGPSDATPPLPPTNVSFSQNNDGTLTLSYNQANESETDVLQYKVYVNGKLFKAIDTIGPLNRGPDDAWKRQDLTFQTTLEGLNVPGRSYDIAISAVDSLSNESIKSTAGTYTVKGSLETHAEVAKADAAPTIDGDVDDAWSDATAHQIEKVVIGDVSGDDDLSGQWRALWDSDALYVLVEVTDNQKSVDSGETHYQDDAIELFVDGDNSKLNSYDGKNDFQIVIPRGKKAASGSIPNELQKDWAWTETDSGYRLEIALHWSSVAPEQDVSAGHSIGFDVQVDDDDGGGERDKKINWHNDKDTSWRNPSTFANVKLVDPDG